MKELEIGAIIAIVIAVVLAVVGQISWWIPLLFVLQSITVKWK